jgi:hypothetical protein
MTSIRPLGTGRLAALPIAGRIPCAQPCTQKIEFLWWDWSCAGKNAQVLLLFRITCVRPPAGGSGTGQAKPGCMMAPALWLGRLLGAGRGRGSVPAPTAAG